MTTRPQNPAITEVRHLVAKGLGKPFFFRCGEQLFSARLAAAHLFPKLPGEYEVFLHSKERPLIPPVAAITTITGTVVEATTEVQQLGFAYRIVLRARLPKSDQQLVGASGERFTHLVPRYEALSRIVNGGETGAERAALDFAIEAGIDHGGWCSKWRRAEDGALASRYQLQETPEQNALQRVLWNVRDSDASVVFTIAPTLRSGNRSAYDYARFHTKPSLHLSARRGDNGCALRAFLAQHEVRVLNVTGPTESSEPEITNYVLTTLRQALLP